MSAFRMRFTTDDSGNAAVHHPSMPSCMLERLLLAYAVTESGESGPTVTIVSHAEGWDAQVCQCAMSPGAPQNNLYDYGPAGHWEITVTGADPTTEYDLSAWTTDIEADRQQMIGETSGGSFEGTIKVNRAGQLMTVALACDESVSGTGQVTLHELNTFPGPYANTIFDSAVELNAASGPAVNNIWDTIGVGELQVNFSAEIPDGTKVTVVTEVASV